MMSSYIDEYVVKESFMLIGVVTMRSNYGCYSFYVNTITRSIMLHKIDKICKAIGEYNIWTKGEKYYKFDVVK